MKLVYILYYIDNYEFQEAGELLVYKEEEKAKEYFELLKKQAISTFEETLEKEDYEIEDSYNYFAIYKKGEYTFNHIQISLEEKEVIE